MSDFQFDILHNHSAWKLPITYKYDHCFVHDNQHTILFSRKELEKLHYHFHHPSVDKLYNLLKRYRPSEVDTSVKNVLEQIRRGCESCQDYVSPPFRFRTSIPPDKILFNHELAIDLLWLDKRPVLHVIDTHTLFQNGVFIKSKKSEDLWKSLIDCWFTVFIGYPSVIRLDREPSFDSQLFRTVAKDQGITLQFSGIEAQNSIGVGERYHAPLRRVFLKIRQQYPRLESEVCLRLALKACNDALGPNGLVPTLLVYGSLPSLPIPLQTDMDQKYRMEALATARAEMETIVAAQRIQKGLRSKIPPSAKYLFKPGEDVKVFREEPKKWIGPFSVVRVENKIITVTDGTKTKPFNVAQVMLMTAPKHDKELRRALDIIFDPEPRYTANYASSDTTIARVLFNERGEHCSSVYLTEVLERSDPRCYDELAQEAILNEIHGLLIQDAFEFIRRKDIAKNPNIVPSQFVHARKNVNTPQERQKARFVVGGHRDKDKLVLIHLSSNGKHLSIRIQLSVSACLQYDVEAQDFDQAYIQASGLLRTIYIKPCKELMSLFNIPDECC